jgi:hypothetical protein
MKYLSWVRNHSQLAVPSLSTTPNAMGKIFMFPSIPVAAASICCAIFNLMKHPYTPKLINKQIYVTTYSGLERTCN